MSERRGEPRWPWVALGLALVSGAGIALEIVLTRIFSVILWYHYGFMTISLGLLGVGLAGIVVYLYPERFARERATHAAGVVSLLFAATVLAALFGFHWIVSSKAHWPLGVGYRSLIFASVGVPFFFAGLAIAIPISRYTDRVGILYSSDLIGAALGAIAAVPLIGTLGAHAAVIVCAALAAMAAVSFAAAVDARRTLFAGGASIALCLMTLYGAATTNYFRIRIAKNISQFNVIAEAWNSFSRVTVLETGPRRIPFGWTLGRGAPQEATRTRSIRIDGHAATPLIQFDGNLADVEYLRYDISSLGYHLRPHRSTLVIGSGGGRDILTARVFGVEQIHAVEVNPLVVGFVRNDFREFSGSPYDLPGVSWSVADGRNYVAQTERTFDHIQMSAVDTTAALAAGALSLVENSLYTVEAFEDYHDHMTADGLLSVTRNWTPESQMMALRTADIVRTAWERRGHPAPHRHVVIIAPPSGPGTQWGTLLASRRPFSDDDLRRLRALADRLGFTLLYSPDGAHTPDTFTALFGPDREGFLREYPYDVRATTDDKPFFFFFLKPLRFGTSASRFAGDQHTHWAARVTPRVLLQAFVLVTALVVVFAFLIPMLLGRLRFRTAAGAGRGLLYFAAIGLGFIMVEIALIQRYTLLLGQPLYAFAGILGCILVCSGFGSLASHSIADSTLRRAARWGLGTVVIGILVHALLMPGYLRTAMHLELPWRVGMTILTIAPLAFVMGMPLPLGMRLMQRESPRALAWAWGVNGSLSVMGTVLAMVVSVFFGITYTILAGSLMYVVAFAAYAMSTPVGEPGRAG